MAKSNSINNITLSGRLTADAATNEAKSFAGFTIAHNMGPEKVIYPEFVMFAKNGKFEKKIPFDLLKKGTPVKVNAYFQVAEKDEYNKTGYRFLVKSVEPLTEAEADAEKAGDNTEEAE